MNNQHRSSFKKILQEFPALGHARIDQNKSYRRDRKIDALKRCESDTAHWQRAQINVAIVDLEHMMNTRWERKKFGSSMSLCEAHHARRNSFVIASLRDSIASLGAAIACSSSAALVVGTQVVQVGSQIGRRFQ
jgi:hypothetical protein